MQPSSADLAFIKWAMGQLEIQTSPNILIGDDHAKAQEVRAMGYYSPSENQIWVLRGDRVPADWYRTLAHELVHWRQRERGDQLDGSDGSEIENEANSKAAVLLREWGRSHPEIYVVPAKIQESTAQYSDLTGLDDRTLERLHKLGVIDLIVPVWIDIFVLDQSSAAEIRRTVTDRLDTEDLSLVYDSGQASLTGSGTGHLLRLRELAQLYGQTLHLNQATGVWALEFEA
jgi:hypothetical protein